MLSKNSEDEIFMHHFEKMSSTSGSFAPDPASGSCPWTLLGDFRPSDPSLPTPGKTSAGAHGVRSNEVIVMLKKIYFRLSF